MFIFHIYSLRMVEADPIILKNYTVYTRLLIFVFVVSIEFYLSKLEECNLLFRRQSIQHSRSSDLLWAGGSWDWIPILVRYSVMSIPAPRPNQRPVQWLLLYSQWKGAGAWRWTLIPMLVTRLRKCWCYKTAFLLCLYRYRRKAVYTLVNLLGPKNRIVSRDR